MLPWGPVYTRSRILFLAVSEDRDTRATRSRNCSLVVPHILVWDPYTLALAASLPPPWPRRDTRHSFSDPFPHSVLPTLALGGNVATYSPSMNMGTYVVVINAEHLVVSGKKFEEKLYKRHPTGRPGSMKIESFKMLQAGAHTHPLNLSRF